MKAVSTEESPASVSENESHSLEMLTDIQLPDVPSRAVEAPATAATMTTKETRTSADTAAHMKHQSDDISAAVSEKKADVASPEEPLQTFTSQQIYQQLVNDESLSIQLTLPDSHTSREALLGYLYQCAGVQFGLLHGDSVTRISPKRYAPLSQWMRLANGYLGQNEKAWLAASGRSGQAVRLFPMALDEPIARFISANLDGEPLLSFSAQYQLQYGNLYLNNIKLNEQYFKRKLQLSRQAC